MSKAGDPVRLGDDVGGGMEPGRYGRIVGIRNADQWDNGKTFGHYVIRKYEETDTTFPTGELYLTALIWPTEW